jgi:hypothetical protein
MMPSTFSHLLGIVLLVHRDRRGIGVSPRTFEPENPEIRLRANPVEARVSG